jgi:hypothetical protein
VLHQILMKWYARNAVLQSIGTERYNKGDEYEWVRILIGMAKSMEATSCMGMHAEVQEPDIHASISSLWFSLKKL